MQKNTAWCQERHTFRTFEQVLRKQLHAGMLRPFSRCAALFEGDIQDGVAQFVWCYE
jgi:hypothetical protein